MDLKEKILATAKPLFFEYGVKRVNIDDICNAMQISKKTFYSVFKKKEQLVEGILLQIRKDKKQQMIIDKNMNIIDLMLKANQKIKQHVEEKKFHFHYDLTKYYPKIYENHCQQTKNDSVNFSLDFINNGISQGVFRTDIDMDLTPQLVSNVFTHFAQLIFVKKKRISCSYLMGFITDAVIRILCNEEGLKYYLEKRNE
ncbi:MAG: TetR/AcrR family transcriptional regulator [Prevotellaceae bacterium]|jgi:AcrR family transcriptional regulator|nr:TetR/AcrR family transcriptional regulator [Prevotellaceae bacterium]